jgi:hypothetical protein
MPDMTEAEIYAFIIKDGDNQEAIRTNTRQLREALEDERERRVHSLTRLDPDNQGRHLAESARIFEEKNRKIDSALLQIADQSSVKLPITREAALKASTEITGSRKLANAARGFIDGIMYMCWYMAMFFGTWVLLSSAINFANGKSLKPDVDLFFNNRNSIIMWVGLVFLRCFLE